MVSSWEVLSHFASCFSGTSCNQYYEEISFKHQWDYGLGDDDGIGIGNEFSLSLLFGYGREFGNKRYESWCQNCTLIGLGYLAGGRKLVDLGLYVLKCESEYGQSVQS